MPFEYKPLDNNYISLDEIREFLSRLVFEAVSVYNTQNSQNNIFLKTKVIAQGDFFQIQDSLLDFDSQIVINVDANENREIVFNQKASNSITIFADISLKILNSEYSKLKSDKMIEYLERALCFNNCYYSQTLSQGFSGKTYKSSLDKNKVKNIQKEENQEFLKTNLQILFKIEK